MTVSGKKDSLILHPINQIGATTELQEGGGYINPSRKVVEFFLGFLWLRAGFISRAASHDFPLIYRL